MENNNLENQKYIRAQKRVKAIKGFYVHLMGIGIVFHAFGVFGMNFILGKNWEDKKIKELMDKDKKDMWE